jgi:ASC-1-like (ASCH) protein
MEYSFDTNDRPFKAIEAGTKTVEGRTLTKFDKTPYDKLQAGDNLTIEDNLTHATLRIEIAFVHHYASVKEMLEKEGPENVMSSEPKTVEHGVESYNSLEGYKEGIEKNGIYAIGLKLL